MQSSGRALHLEVCASRTALVPQSTADLVPYSMITFLIALEFIFYHHSIASAMVTLSIIATPLVTVVAILLFVNYMSDSVPPGGNLVLFRKFLSWRFRLKREDQEPRSNAGMTGFPIFWGRGSPSDSPLPLHNIGRGVPAHDVAVSDSAVLSPRALSNALCSRFKAIIIVPQFLQGRRLRRRTLLSILYPGVIVADSELIADRSFSSRCIVIALEMYFFKM